MTSFPAAARRVRDLDLAQRDRLLSLRECVLRFPPYGFRATWHHLMVSAGVPRRLDEDPLSLRRAVDELEQARLLWLARDQDYAARRRREKEAGRPTPRRVPPWHSSPSFLAYCPDFDKHPTLRLATVVRRILSAYESGADLAARCRVCGQALAANTTCPECGVYPHGPGTAPRDTRTDTAHRWRQTWQRTCLRPAR